MLKVFLNHAAEDRALVMPYFHKLKALGFDPWIDQELLPGQHWDEEIQRNFNASDVYLIFLSPRSVTKRGYVQREIAEALDKQLYNLPGDIGLIPVMLEQCEVPARIARFYQYIRLPEGWNDVVRSLQIAAEQRSVAINTGVEMGPFRMFLRQERHVWEGLPGYDTSLLYPHVESDQLSKTAIEVNEFIASTRLGMLLNVRQARMEQEEEFYRHWGRDPRNSFDFSISPSLVSGKILSFIIHESGMSAGAAHGFNLLETANFLILDGELVKVRFYQFLDDPRSAYPKITRLVRAKVAKEYAERYEKECEPEDHERAAEALPDDGSIFEQFIIKPSGFTFIYPEIFGYAMGGFGADLSFEELVAWLKPGGPHTLAQEASEISWDPVRYSSESMGTEGDALDGTLPAESEPEL